MPNLAPQTHVADHSCPDCGKNVRVVLNKNGMAYYFCPWTNDSGERCNHKQQWGRSSSQKMQIAYLQNKGVSPEEKPANDNTQAAESQSSQPSRGRNPDQPKPEWGDVYRHLTE